MKSQEEPTNPTPRNLRGRLDGWKEIAAYLGKSVRAVQRWEEERGLPVHRLPGTRRDVVYAFTSELDKWLATAGSSLTHEPRQGEVESTDALPPQEPIPSGHAHPESHAPPIPLPTDIPPEPRRTHRLALIVAGGLLLAVLVATVLHFYSKLTPPGPPVRLETRDHLLVALDSAGKKVWEHAFPASLRPRILASPHLVFHPRGFVSFEDLDADGAPEALVALAAEETMPHGVLFCFDSKGELRWQFAYSSAVSYGQGTFRPPFRIAGFRVLRAQSGAPPDIWFVAQHLTEFPVVLLKLNARGQVLGRFHHPGHATALEFMRAGGRNIILLGGTNNEFKAASLALVDYDRPDGHAPASNPEYDCLNCPESPPLGYVVFPRTPLAVELNRRASVAELSSLPDEELQITTFSASLDERSRATEHYTFDGAMRLLRAEFTDGHIEVHNQARIRGLIRDPLNLADETPALLAGVRYWNGSAFVPYSTRAGIRFETHAAHARQPRSVLLPHAQNAEKLSDTSFPAAEATTKSAEAPAARNRRP